MAMQGMGGEDYEVVIGIRISQPGSNLRPGQISVPADPNPINNMIIKSWD